MVNMENKYLIDKNNSEVIIDKNNYQVMMEWEKKYMQELIQFLNPKGDVLEIGFGLGYSASAIQSYNIKSHTIIEADKESLKKAEEWGQKQKKPVYLIEGLWQDTIGNLGTFDSFFKDESPRDDFPDPLGVSTYDFIYRILESHVKKESVFSWYMHSNLNSNFFLCNSNFDYTCKVFNHEIPKECNYIEKNESLFLPKITFKNGIRTGVKKIALGIDYNLYEIV